MYDLLNDSNNVMYKSHYILILSNIRIIVISHEN